MLHRRACATTVSSNVTITDDDDVSKKNNEGSKSLFDGSDLSISGHRSILFLKQTATETFSLV